jgi:MFS family permease
METWPASSRGFMGGVSSAVYGLLYTHIGWRGLLWLGILPAVAVFYVEVWAENRRRQRAEMREVRAPLFTIFKRELLTNESDFARRLPACRVGTNQILRAACRRAGSVERTVLPGDV